MKLNNTTYSSYRADQNNGARRKVSIIGLCTLLFAALISNPTAAQSPVIPEPDLSAARALLNMSPADANEAIKKYNAREAEILNTQLLSLLRPRNPDVDRVYGLIRHLETLRADAQAQNRLNTLLYVLALTLLLFTAFLIYVIMDQRNSLRALQKLLGSGAGSKAPDSSQDIYRGE